MFRVAILYICTGNYKIFWPGFYASAEKYLFKEQHKTYYVFTDTDSHDEIFKACQNVNIVFQQKLGWPYDTLMRFEMFHSQIDQLIKYDYIYFFNANVRFLKPIGDDLIPPADTNGLVAVIHPGYVLDSRLFFPYERNRKSLAYIPYYKGRHYYMGGLNGGTSKAYTQLIQTLRDNIETDLHNGIIALWHDESHLNNYLQDKSIYIKGPEYGIPEGSIGSSSAKIIFLDKRKLGGYEYLRGTDLGRIIDDNSTVGTKVNTQGYANTLAIDNRNKEWKRKNRNRLRRLLRRFKRVFKAI